MLETSWLGWDCYVEGDRHLLNGERALGTQDNLENCSHCVFLLWLHFANNLRWDIRSALYSMTLVMTYLYDWISEQGLWYSFEYTKSIPNPTICPKVSHEALMKTNILTRVGLN